AGKHPGYVDKLCGETEPGDAAAEVLGKKPRRSADAATDVEHLLATADLRELCQAHGRIALSGMELVDRREIVRCQAVEVLAGRSESREDRLAERAARIMILDRSRVRHGRRSASKGAAALSSGLGRQSAVGEDDVAVDVAEPFPGQIVSRSRDRDRAVRAPAALLTLALHDHLDEERVAARCADA